MLAIDIGTGMTKFAVPGEKEAVVDLWPSVAGRIGEATPTFAYDRLPEVVVDGERWIVGEDVESALSEDACESTLSREWAGSPGWRAILYRVIAHLHPGGGDLDPLTIVTGLPQEHFYEDWPQLIDCLQGEHEFVVAGVPYRVEIHPFVVPQPFGALAWAARWDEQVLDAPSAVVDVGTYTSDYAVLKNNRLQRWRSGGIEVGLSTLHELLAEWVEREYRYRPTLADLSRILPRREIGYRGTVVSVGEMIDQMAARAFAPLTERLDEAWRGGGADLVIYLAGGGGEVAEPAVRAVAPHAKVVPDPVFAVVRGMLEFGLARSADDGG